MTTERIDAPCLTPDILIKLAHDELLPAEEAIVEQHLDRCEHCRELMESVSIDENWSTNVWPALSSTSDLFTPPELQFPLELDEVPLESIVKLLGPTDDPRMLGRIASYEVVGVIGRGGMGIVFKAFDAALNRYVTIKMLLPQLAASGAARKRFAREGQAAAAVINDFVLPIYCVSEWQGIPYLVMQYSRGSTLQKRIHDQGPLELEEVLRIGMQCARGLAAAHAQGLVHRDIKPSNILIDSTVERAMLMDFGLARAVDDASITRTGVIAGTPQYMSPEQARGESIDARSDLFSLGSLIYAMCTARPPFRAEGSYAVLRRIAESDPHDIRELNPAIPDWLCGIVRKLMEKKAGARFHAASEVADLLQQCLAHTQQPNSYPLPPELVRRPVEPQNFGSVSLKGNTTMFMKLTLSTVALLTLLSAAIFVTPGLFTHSGDDFAPLQGEWRLVAEELDGQKRPDDHNFFNERLKIDKNRLARFQTLPNGSAIQAESGSIALHHNESGKTIDIRCRMGTIRGLYKIEGDQLTLCLTKEGGERPTGFTTAPRDLHVLQVFEKQKNVPFEESPSKESDQVSDEATLERNWLETWSQRIPKELSGAPSQDTALKWMEDNHFTEIRSGELTDQVIHQMNPDVQEGAYADLKNHPYVFGKIRRDETDSKACFVELYCLFDKNDKLVSMQVTPCCKRQ